MDSRARRASDAFELKLREGAIFDEEQILLLKNAFEDGIVLLYNDIDSSISEIKSTLWRKAKEY